MGYTFLDHTADVGVVVRAATRNALFAEALRAFTDTLTPIGGVAASLHRRFRVEADEAGELMVVWLEELLYAFEVEELLFAAAEVAVEEVEGRLTLSAEARGERYDPDRHPLKVLIKGVTFHRLEVCERAAGGWLARVIFDI